MKLKFKKKYVIIFALLVVVSSVIVYAVDNLFTFTKTYSTKEQLSAFTAQYNRSYKFNDGRLNISYEGNIDDEKYDEYKITYVDKEGKEIASKILGDYSHINRIFTDGTDVYYLWYNKTDSTYGMTILDKDFKELGVVNFKETYTTNVYYSGFYKRLSNIYHVNKEHRYEGEDFGSIVRDGDYIYYYVTSGGLSHILKIDINYNYTVFTTDDAEFKDLETKYFPLIGLMFEDSKDGYNDPFHYYYLYTKIDEDSYVAGGTTFETVDARMKLVKSGETKWEITNDNYVTFSNIKIVNDYIITIADYKANAEYANERSDILIYNMDGELVQKISNNSMFVSLVSEDNSFLVNRYYTEGDCANAAATVETANIDPYITTVERLYTTSDVWDSTMCKTYYYTERYSLNNDTTKEDSIIPDTTENPNTKVGATLILILLILTSIIFFNIGVRKIAELT